MGLIKMIWVSSTWCQAKAVRPGASDVLPCCQMRVLPQQRSLSRWVVEELLYQGGCPSTSSRDIMEELVLVLHRLCNQISSSTYSSVVQGHVEVLGAPWGDLTMMRSQLDSSQARSPREETRLLGSLCIECYTWPG